MERRNFIKHSFLSMAAVAFFGRVSKVAAQWQEKFKIKRSEFWTGNHFHQNHVDASKLTEGAIRARIDGQWETFTLRELSDGFMTWSMEDRLANLETMRNGKMPDWSGAHNAAVASWGKQRGDSRFTLNNAIKGTGLCPKPEHIKSLLQRLDETREQPHPEKFQVLESLYKDLSLWDRTKLISLELYAKPDFETHTFLNQMENPVSSIVYLDIPSYELRTISQLLHPQDPALSDLERQYVTYINSIHTYMHSHFKATVPAVLYHVIEMFDNSPASRGGQGKKGLRVV